MPVSSRIWLFIFLNKGWSFLADCKKNTKKSKYYLHHHLTFWIIFPFDKMFYTCKVPNNFDKNFVKIFRDSEQDS